MDKSLSNYELTESTLNIETDSENGSDPLVELDDNVSSSNSNKSDEDFDNNLPPTVTLLKHEKTGAKVYLIGTAHFSKESQEDVVKVMTNVKPNVVIIELCPARMNILNLDEETLLNEAKNIDFAKMTSIIKSNGLYNGIMYLFLLSTSAQITKQLGMAPGGEFRTAYKESMKISNCGVHLADRPIDITIKRALGRLSWFQTFKLIWYIVSSQAPISKEDIENCKKRDMVEQLLAEMANDHPVIQEVFLDERDIFLTNSLQLAALAKLRPESGAPEISSGEPLKIVGVVGMGHMPGIIRLWPTPQHRFIKDILTVPPPSTSSIVIKYTFKISILALGGYLVYKYVPVPRVLKENMHLIARKVASNIKASPSLLKFQSI